MRRVTDTLTNEAPMLTEGLEFDLGDVLKCAGNNWTCGAEATWLGDTVCGCWTDIPFCDSCKVKEDDLIARDPLYACRACLHIFKPGHIKWRRL